MSQVKRSCRTPTFLIDAMSHFTYLFDLAQDNTPEPDADLEHEAAGKWDGMMSLDPEHPEDDRYWVGYCLGLRQKYLKQQAHD